MRRIGKEGRKKAPPRAIALGYVPERDPAPKVLACGAGETARRILRLAAEKGIPVRQDPCLLEVLSGLDVGQEIPVEVYQAVAEILVFLYRLEEAGLRRPDAAGAVGPTT